MHYFLVDYRSVTRSYYRGAAGALLVYDITRSVDNLRTCQKSLCHTPWIFSKRNRLSEGQRQDQNFSLNSHRQRSDCKLVSKKAKKSLPFMLPIFICYSVRYSSYVFCDAVWNRVYLSDSCTVHYDTIRKVLVKSPITRCTVANG